MVREQWIAHITYVPFQVNHVAHSGEKMNMRKWKQSIKDTSVIIHDDQRLHAFLGKEDIDDQEVFLVVQLKESMIDLIIDISPSRDGGSPSQGTSMIRNDLSVFWSTKYGEIVGFPEASTTKLQIQWSNDHSDETKIKIVCCNGVAHVNTNGENKTWILDRDP